ncbi:MAG: SUMF1/EgtB/PvdO family nonheme iron enzyme, partial [Bacteroidales bacterium]|nr:SUMF1/EgtB/PvdO family nonheme iron enzyme [Bacteroidales bacterium]
MGGTGVQLTKEQSTIGTAAYMSPEQTRGETIDHRTDIWSIGIVLYEMLTGQPPFKGEYEQAVVFSILNEDPKPMKFLRPEIPRELQEIVERTLDKDPDSRISSAAGLLEQLKGYQLVSKRADAGDFGIKPLLTRIRRPRIAIPTILMVAISMFFAIQFYTRSLKVRWARYEVPPKIFSLLQEQKTVDAFLLIRQAQRYIPDDPQLEMLLSTMSFPRTVLTTPSGADVYFKDYMGVDAEWQYLGRTPMDNTFMPVGYLRLRIIRQGFETVIRAVNVYHMGDTLRIKLIPKGTGVPGMVLVPEGNQRLGSGNPVELQEYWIDKYEVTNRKYMEFVDAGGYQKREYWKQPIVKDGSTLSWEQAMTEFRDATGRLGPLTWKLGTYPDGQAEYPVQGVSWYEAAAYAEFAGKSLPTVYHWRQAAGFGIFSDILTLSNFYEEGPVPGQTYPGLSLYGCFDMAGNVKEWCLNETEGWRYILGGAWNEPAYMF